MLRWLLLALIGCPATDTDSDTDVGYVDADQDGWDETQDCDDSNAEVNPGAVETCNGIDDDCDGLIDDEDDAVTDRDPYYTDGDGDGYGDEGGTVVFACEQPSGSASSNDDCDDEDADIHPDAPEEDCTDPTDYNCDGSVGYDDADGDGFPACEDCDDADGAITTGDTYYADADGDGYGDEDNTTEACSLPSGYVENFEDCDDADYDTNPSVEEECEDGIDNDCDGLTDDADLARWYEDADGDGFGSESGGFIQCEAPSGYVEDNTDCDDDDADINPDAEEVWYDGVDQDCDDADDYDQDGDGYEYDAYGGDDCDDEDADINPDATEELDGTDQDCDDAVDELAAEDMSAAEITGSGVTGFGFWVSAGGDVDGDGTIDLVGSTQQGRHALMSGPLTADASTADGYTLKTSGTATSSKAIITPDVDGDGYDDVLVGLPYGNSYQGAAYLVRGPITATTTFSSDYDYVIEGDSTYDYLGTSIAAGDLDGDGYGDLVVSANGFASNYAGAVYVFRGPLTSDLTASDADAAVEGSGTYEYLGYSVDVADDIDGDGLQDVVAGARLSSYGATYGGAAYVFFGPVTDWGSESDDADTIAYASSTYSYAGAVVRGAGDATGDGYGDFLVSSVQKGTVWLMSGSLTGATSLDYAHAEISGAGATSQLGTALASGDFNGDGEGDIVATAPYAESFDGQAFLLTGPLTGELDVDDYSSFTGDAEYLGSAADMADLNDDGFDDLILGATGNDDNGSNTGALWVITGRSW